jgi:hypothetical protein
MRGRIDRAEAGMFRCWENNLSECPIEQRQEHVAAPSAHAVVRSALRDQGWSRRLSERVAGARAGGRGWEPPLLAARGLDVFGPAQVDRRREILGQQRGGPIGAADPAAGAVAKLVLRLLQQSRLGQQVEQGRGDRLGAKKNPGVDRGRQPAERVVRPGRVFVVGARRAQPRPHRQQPHGRRVPGVVDVIVRGVVGLPFGQGAAQPGFVFCGRHQPLVVV